MIAKNSPISIRRVSNGFYITNNHVRETVTDDDIAVEVTLDGLIGWILKHFDDPAELRKEEKK